LSEANLHGNEEEADSPAQVSVSGTLLHKGHEFGDDKSPPHGPWRPPAQNKIIQLYEAIERGLRRPFRAPGAGPSQVPSRQSMRRQHGAEKPVPQRQNCQRKG